MPLKLTTEVATNPVPFIINVNPAEPAVTLAGESVVTAGAGLLIVNGKEFDATPPDAGFRTFTCTVPAVTNSDPGMFAVIVVPPFVTVPGLAVLLKKTVAPVTKPVPVMVSGLTVASTSAEVGASEVRTGTPLLTICVSTGDVVPMKFVSPPYCAVMECTPWVRVDVANVAFA